MYPSLNCILFFFFLFFKQALLLYRVKMEINKLLSLKVVDYYDEESFEIVSLFVFIHSLNIKCFFTDQFYYWPMHTASYTAI